MEADLESGAIRKIVVWRLDRLSRTASSLTTLSDLTARKITLVLTKDGLHLATPAGRLVANVLASVAQYETEVRAERVMAGLAVARAKGVKLGGSKKGRPITVTEEQIKAVRRYRAEGMAMARIALAVALSRPTVYRLIGEVD
jgi:DNA invertase Pin-like site-specific DNA recombinase